MFIDNHFIDRAMSDLDEAFELFCSESLPREMNRSSAKYDFLVKALETARSNPLHDESTQRALELRIQHRINCAKSSINLGTEYLTMRYGM